MEHEASLEEQSNMCGIAGIFNYDVCEAADRHTLDEMLTAIEHRGPDDRGVLLDEYLAIGMQRLSIIDLAGGNQPMSNEDGTVSVVFNGEIYNYRELQARLRTRGHILRSQSDTEVIVHLYEELGPECVQELHGMFGFAVWDSRCKRLFLARDRLGIKPLYYWMEKGVLLFASEIKALLMHPGVAPSLNMEALGHYISLKYVPAPETMFRGINALPPGCSLTCDRHGASVRRYWQLRFENSCSADTNEEHLAEQLGVVLHDAVKRQVVSDVPFGAFLSGGVDSSAIVALMTQILDTPVKTFSVGFDGAGAEAFSELRFARMVANRLGTDHHEILVTPNDIMNLAERVIWHLDQPIADNACIANYMLAELASRKVKMVLTGEGGDELFAGYARYPGERWSSLFQLIPASVKSAFLKVGEHMHGLRRPKIALTALCQKTEIARLANWFPLFNATMKRGLMTEEAFKQISDPFAEIVLARQLDHAVTPDWLSRMLFLDTTLWLPDDLLARGDKTSMAASIEARVPLLDDELVEFATSLPSSLKLRGFTRKYILKQVVRQWLPQEVIDRKKEGFPMPFSLWFRRECREFVHDLLSSSTVTRRGLFQPAYIEFLLKEHDGGVADHSHLIWGLLSVELWCRAFLDTRLQRTSFVPDTSATAHPLAQAWS